MKRARLLVAAASVAVATLGAVVLDVGMGCAAGAKSTFTVEFTARKKKRK